MGPEGQYIGAKRPNWSQKAKYGARGPKLMGPAGQITSTKAQMEQNRNWEMDQK